MMMWRSLKAGSILAALRQPSKPSAAPKQPPQKAAPAQPKTAH